jgi:hypothetical protein
MNKNRMLSTDGETNCTTRPEVEVKSQKIDWLAKRKIYSPDRSVPKKIGILFRMTWSDGHENE